MTVSGELIFRSDYLHNVGVELFTACGAPRDEARIVADVLVDASLMGLDSHGVMRYAQYVNEALDGRVKPGAPTRVVKETGSTALVDCGHNFGAVSATRMTAIAGEKATRSRVACVASLNCRHVGRLGHYVQRLAEEGLFALATCNSSKHGHFVVPWGGREGRLATNPLAYAAPAAGNPVVFDMSTSMIAEGKIRVLMNTGRDVPEGCVLDADGNPTTDPRAFYGPPRGSILPLGGGLGYKGYGLGMLVEILGGLLAGMASSEDLPYVNGLMLLAIDPDAFCGRDRFVELVTDLCAYHMSSPAVPGHDAVVIPGARDFSMNRKRLAEGIPVDAATWRDIDRVAAHLGITLDPAEGCP